jgi:hypothetical protein
MTRRNGSVQVVGCKGKENDHTVNYDSLLAIEGKRNEKMFPNTLSIIYIFCSDCAEIWFSLKEISESICFCKQRK